MNSSKSARVSEDIKRQLSLIARELKDPRVKDKMLSFVRVEVTNDLSFAKIYVSAMEGIEIAKEAVKGLTSATGFIKRELSNNLHLRKSPELKFVPDDSIEYSAHLNQIFLEMEKKEHHED